MKVGLNGLAKIDRSIAFNREVSYG